MRRISNACISGAPCSLGPRPFPGSPRAIATDGPGSSLGDRSVLGSGSTLEGGSVANMRRTTVSSAAAYRIRERGSDAEACGIGRRSAARRQRDDFLGCQWLAPSKDQPANHPPWGGVRPAAWPPPPLESEPSLACVLTYAWRVSRCDTTSKQRAGRRDPRRCIPARPLTGPRPSLRSSSNLAPASTEPRTQSRIPWVRDAERTSLQENA
jgi:hypothetical protein